MYVATDVPELTHPHHPGPQTTYSLPRTVVYIQQVWTNV